MQNNRSVLDRIWTMVPPGKLRAATGNILDVMKARFLGRHFGPAFQSPCYCLWGVCSLLLIYISLWRGGKKERWEQYRRGWETNAYEEVVCGDTCLVILHGCRQALPEARMRTPEVGWALWQRFQPWWDMGSSDYITLRPERAWSKCRPCL